MPKQPTINPEWLDLRFDCDDLDGEVSIREYFAALLSAVWEEQEGFSGKRPFGNSGWYCDLRDALATVGVPANEYPAVVSGLIQLLGK
jgi:hypothetical protein